MVNLLIPGTVKSFGVLFVEFLEVFDTSPATAAWIPALCYFLYSSLGKIYVFFVTLSLSEDYNFSLNVKNDALKTKCLLFFL